ncbi:MAG: MarC family protein [Planctomycetota bacterium]
MSEMVQHAVTVFMAFFAVMNPIANTAVFSGLAGGRTRGQQMRVATTALLVAFAVVAAFAVMGKAIFHLFGITLPALRIAGGVLVFMIGYTMLRGEASAMHRPKRKAVDAARHEVAHEPPMAHGAESDRSDAGEDALPDIAVSPLALPILAGPGTLATAMNFSAAGGLANVGATIGAFAVLCGITWVCFVLGQRVVRLIGPAGLSIVTRLMGLIMAVIGVQMGIEGVAGAIAAAG